MITILVLMMLLIGDQLSAQTIPEISWSNARTGGGGNATGILPDWTVTDIPLLAGINPITVTYQNPNGTAQDSIIVTFAPTFPGNTLAGAWGFDEPSGLSTTDSSGNSNTGTLVNGATRVLGRFGTAVSFNPSLQQRVDVNDNNSLDFTQSFALSAWVMPVAVHNDFRAVLVKDYMIFLYASTSGGSGCPSGTPMIGFYANGSGALGTLYRVCAPNPLPIGQFSHVAGTYDGSTLRLFINGVQCVGCSLSTNGQQYIESTTGQLKIGASQFGEYFDGLIDEPRAYNWGIPTSAGSNTVPGAACVFGNPLDTSQQSVIRDMNCSVVQPAPSTVMFKIPSSATGLKIGPSAAGLKLGK